MGNPSELATAALLRSQNSQILNKLAQDKQTPQPSSLLTQMKRLFKQEQQQQPSPALQAPQRILVLGIEGAGLTTFLEALHIGPLQTTIPYIGMNIESVRYRDLEFISWAVDGCRNDYPRWHHLFSGTVGIIQIVDVAETVRFIEAMECMGMCEGLFAQSRSGGDSDGDGDGVDFQVPLLILGNKIDLATARRQNELDYDVTIRGVARGWTWRSQMTNCLTGDGIAEGLRWLVDAIVKRREELLDDDDLTLTAENHEKEAIAVLEK